MSQWSAGFRRHKGPPALAGESIPVYELSNDSKQDLVYQYLFTHPGILVLRDFPLTESRFHVLRKSFSYEEIAEEMYYCFGSKETAENLAWCIKDDLFAKDAFFLYPEVIKVAVEASVATIVHDQQTKEWLHRLCPQSTIFYIPDTNYDSVLRASGYLKQIWKDPRGNFPRHLQPLEIRTRTENVERFKGEIPNCLFAG